MYSTLIIIFLIIVLIFINMGDVWLKLIYPTEIWTDEGDLSRTHPANEKAVLLIHEFSGTPDSLAGMAQYIFSLGWDIVIPAMPGSTKSAEVLAKKPPSLYYQWVNKAQEILTDMHKKYKSIVIVGASLGGSIALELACRTPEFVSGIVTMATPLKLSGRHFRRKYLRNTMLLFSGLFSLFTKTTRTGRLSTQARDLVPLEGVEGVLVLPAVHSHKTGLRRLRARLGAVRAPLLSLHVRTDRTVDVKNQDLICSLVSSDWIIKKRWEMTEDHTRHHCIWSHKHIKKQVWLETGFFLSRIIER